MKIFIIVVVMALCVAGLVAVMGPGQKSTSTTKSSVLQAVTPAPRNAVGLSVDLRVDDTFSILPEDRAKGEAVLLKVAEEAIDAGKFTTCKIQHLGERGWLVNETIVPLPVKNQTPCQEAAIKEEQSWYKPIVEHEQKKADQNCEQQRMATNQEYENKRSEALRLIAQAIHSGEQIDSSCTSFYDALANAALTNTPGVIAILSDGVDTCTTAIAAIPKPNSDVKIVLIMLPNRYERSKNRSEFSAFTKQKNRLQKHAPWLRVEPPRVDSVKGIS